MTRIESPRYEEYRKRMLSNRFHYSSQVKKSECKRKQIPFDLDGEYLESIWTDNCPILGLPLKKPFEESGRGSVSTAHLDRRDPDKGYVKGNVAWISGRANRIKYDATPHELQSILDWMTTH